MGLVKLDGVSIDIDPTITKMGEYLEVLAHEFGHAKYSIENPSSDYKWNLLDSYKNGVTLSPGHHKYNPSGKAAKEEENRFWAELTRLITQYLSTK